MDTNDRAQDYPENFKLFEIIRQQIEKSRKKNLWFFFKIGRTTRGQFSWLLLAVAPSKRDKIVQVEHKNTVIRWVVFCTNIYKWKCIKKMLVKMYRASLLSKQQFGYREHESELKRPSLKYIRNSDVVLNQLISYLHNSYIDKNLLKFFPFIVE